MNNFLVKGLLVFLPFVVLMSVWLPELSHWYVVVADSSDADILKMRKSPSDDVLRELSEFTYDSRFRDDAEILVLARRVMGGRIAFKGFPEVAITLPFSSDDLEATSPSLELTLASLAETRLLLDAYRITRESVYLTTAKDRLIGFMEYERNALLPKGFLWNDHAIAERILVFTKFWYWYRQASDFDVEIARQLIFSTKRHMEFLVRSDHYASHTNHGVMQNLAVMHACIAFPAIETCRVHVPSVVARLKEQLRYYVNEEGVVLEHSAGYHRFGVHLLSIGLRYFYLSGIHVDPVLARKYDGAKTFLAALQRPDGTLPAIGDTRTHGVRRIRPVVLGPGGVSYVDDAQEALRPRSNHVLKPEAGYFVRWSGLDDWPVSKGLSQLVVAWSDFATRAHKKDDELGLVLWADGRDWLTQSGYWPYGDNRRDEAIGWAGSNAPHPINTEQSRPRRSELIFVGNGEQLSTLELVRTHADSYAVRREFVSVAHHTLIVIDHFSDKKNRDSRVVWTVAPGIKLEKAPLENAFSLTVRDESQHAALAIGSNRLLDVSIHKGSADPFAGWTADQAILAVPAVVLQAKNEAWLVSVWHLGELIEFLPEIDQPDRWKIHLNTANGGLDVNRHGAVWTIKDEIFGFTETIVGQEFSNHPMAKGQAKLDQYYDATRDKYQKFPILTVYRIKVSILVLALLLAQFLFFWILARYAPRFKIISYGLSIAAWVTLGVWLNQFYFVT